MSSTTTSPDSLRRLVRELIAELTPAARAAAAAPGSTSAEHGPHSQRNTANDAAPEKLGSSNPPAEVSQHSAPGLISDVVVSVSTDTELTAFVNRIQHIYDDPSTRADLQAGRIRFRLAAARSEDTPKPNGRARHRVTKLLVTERDVAAAHQAQVTLLISSRAVVTPLARDKAKALHVIIEKER